MPDNNNGNSDNKTNENPQTPNPQTPNIDPYSTPVGTPTNSDHESEKYDRDKSIIFDKVENSDNRARNWENLFDGNICIGENHDNINAKKFLIQNMSLFKEKGFEYIILEHFSQDKHQIHIDNFLSGKDEEPSQILRDHINDLNIEHMDEDFKEENYNEQKGHYNFESIIYAAKKFDLKIICAEKFFSNYKGINTELLDQIEDDRNHAKKRSAKLNSANFKQKSHGKNRIEELNNNIKEIAESLADRKWVALVGSGHINERYGVPGITEILPNVQDLYVKDSTSKDTELNLFERKEKIESFGDFIKASIVIQAPIDTDLSYNNLKAKYIKNSQSNFVTDLEDNSPSPTKKPRSSISLSKIFGKFDEKDGGKNL